MGDAVDVLLQRKASLFFEWKKLEMEKDVIEKKAKRAREKLDQVDEALMRQCPHLDKSYHHNGLYSRETQCNRCGLVLNIK